MSIKDIYQRQIIKNLATNLNIKNVNRIPRLKKISVNIGIGSYAQKFKKFDLVVENLAKITGQKPIIVNSKIAISNFKLRKGMPVGVKITLRGKKMYDFLERLINIVFPRLRDFRGFSSKAFDGRGNYSVGLDDCTVFPEIILNDLSKTHGVQVVIDTSAKSNEEGKALLLEFGFPFKKDNK